ncbi:uncharacterized protein LOC141656500 [Silene latifolia]|uniref:uncharacterized protein LOC141656500 n=1 Tax=Silene latifolia TaxID=37657 RepID=UPI003D789D0A
MSKQPSTTLLALIPKKAVVATMMDYRPIACCTVFYKTVSKILCVHLKPFLSQIVGKEQGAFVQGRNIFENIMLTLSLVKGYGQKGVSPRCLIKVDIKKAFDSLQWEFIDKMLQYYNFPPEFKNWILGCITSTWFSLKINGDRVGFFKDDLMLFVRGDIPFVVTVTQALKSFAKMSGLCANPEKTNIYMGGVRDNIKQGILQGTGYVEGAFPFRYLGLPLNDGKLNKGMFADLINKVQKALQHWSTYKLSYAGKISLLNSVIFGMEQYWCSTLLIPKGEGGFNIKEVLAWNKCILGKWIWELDNDLSSIWSEWNLKYNIKSRSIWTATSKATHSESWRSILKVRDELLIHTRDIQTAKQFMSSCVHQGKIQLHLLYDKFRHHGHPISWARTVWQRAVQPKHSVFLILAMQKKLATIDQLNYRGIHVVNRCVLCKNDNEDHKHLFFKCQFSKEIWQKILSWMKISGRTNNLSKDMHWSANRCTCRHWKTKWFLGCLGAVVYSIWEERNTRIFRGLEQCVDFIIKKVQYIVIIRLLYVSQSHREEEIVGSLAS